MKLYVEIAADDEHLDIEDVRLGVSRMLNRPVQAVRVRDLRVDNIWEAAIEVAAHICAVVDAHGPTSDESAAEAGHQIRALKNSPAAVQVDEEGQKRR